MVHSPGCKSIEDHVEREMSDPAAAFPRLPAFVRIVIDEWCEEQALAATIAFEPFAGCGDDWTPGELQEAWGR